MIYASLMANVCFIVLLIMACSEERHWRRSYFKLERKNMELDLEASRGK